MLLKRWVDSSLEIYRPELNSMMYPIFIYLFLKLVAMDRIIARRFFDKFSSDFSIQHGTEINRLFSVNSVDHIKKTMWPVHLNRISIVLPCQGIL